MSRSAKLDNLPPRKSAADDMRSYAHKVEEFLLEILEHLKTTPKSVSRDLMITRLEHFILTDELPLKSN